MTSSRAGREQAPVTANWIKAIVASSIVRDWNAARWVAVQLGQQRRFS
jgi:hypothetical protein